MCYKNYVIGFDIERYEYKTANFTFYFFADLHCIRFQSTYLVISFILAQLNYRLFFLIVNKSLHISIDYILIRKRTILVIEKL